MHHTWIRFPVAGDDGYPKHVGGVADGENGLYFMGLPFQTRLASGLIGGQGPDAAFVAETIATRLAEPTRAAVPAAAPRRRLRIRRQISRCCSPSCEALPLCWQSAIAAL